MRMRYTNNILYTIKYNANKNFINFINFILFNKIYNYYIRIENRALGTDITKIQSTFDDSNLP